MAEVGELKFVDHVECKIHSPEKEVISPTKATKPTFPNMTNGNSQVNQSENGIEVTVEGGLVNGGSGSDDAVNNNTNLLTKSHTEQVKVELNRNLYLDKEVPYNENDKGDGERYTSELNLSGRKESTSSATMNLFWYSGTAMNVDLDEIEAFKNSQGETYTSSLQITTGNGYYKSKVDGEKADISGNAPASAENRSVSKSPEKDTWSSAFESASSRFLGLASELKSQPKLETHETNASKKDEHHPWGLEREKVVAVSGDMNTEVLPDLSVFEADHDTTDGKVSEDGRRIKGTSITKAEMEDEADAIGYMDLKDSPKGANLKGKDNTSVPDGGNKPVEEKFASTELSALEAKKQTEAKVSSTTGVEQFISPVMSQNISCQVKGTTVEMGTDVVDSSQKIDKIEEMIQVSTANPVQAPVQPPVPDPFTVKRTYYIGANSEKQIETHGGIFIETETLVDEYLDNNDYSLTLKDCWLRLRNKKFEMKMNAGFGYANGSAQLLTSEWDIKEALLNMFAKEFDQKRKVSENQLDVLVDSLAMEEFTTFETRRNKYQIGDCMVTIDQTNFGILNGEIEMIADYPAQIPQVLSTIEKLSSNLGFLQDLIGDDFLLFNTGPKLFILDVY